MPPNTVECGLRLREVGCVLGFEFCKLFRKVILEENCFNRADFGTDAAINALHRVDEVLFLIVIGMDAVDRTNLDT
jgi:hypothetical protein